MLNSANKIIRKNAVENKLRRIHCKIDNEDLPIGIRRISWWIRSCGRIFSDSAPGNGIALDGSGVGNYRIFEL